MSSPIKLAFPVWIGLVLLTATNVAAQSVNVQVSSRAITQEDDLQVVFSFSGGNGTGQLPSFSPDWKVAGTSRGMKTQIINGRMSRETTETVVLVPTRSGQLTIKSAAIVSNGTVLARSEPVVISVRRVAALKPSEAKKPITRDTVLLLPHFNRDVYYVGEPFVATWNLYVRSGQRITSPEIGELQTPDGVQRQDVLKGQIGEEGRKRIFNSTYVRVPVLREVWKVLRPDVVQVGSLKVATSLGRGLFNQNTKRLKSPPLTLEIRGVPTRGRPDAYREGTIGIFELKSRLKYDESQGRALFELVVQGSGSLETIDTPTLMGVTGATTRSLASDDRDEIVADSKGIHGKRVFQYLLTPERPGTVFVPEVTLTYFNPKLGRFATTKTEPISFVAKKAVASTRTKAVGVQGQDDANADLHPIESDSDLSSQRTKPLHTSPWYWAILALPFLVFLGLSGRSIWMNVRTASSGKNRIKKAHFNSKKQLKQAEQLASAGKSNEFYTELSRTIRTYVSDKHSVVLAGQTNDQIRQSLSDLGYSVDIAKQLIGELENCDFARFAKSVSESDEMQKALERCGQLLATMEANRVS